MREAYYTYQVSIDDPCARRRGGVAVACGAAWRPREGCAEGPSLNRRKGDAGVSFVGGLPASIDSFYLFFFVVQFTCEFVPSKKRPDAFWLF